MGTGGKGGKVRRHLVDSLRKAGLESWRKQVSSRGWRQRQRAMQRSGDERVWLQEKDREADCDMNAVKFS